MYINSEHRYLSLSRGIKTTPKSHSFHTDTNKIHRRWNKSPGSGSREAAVLPIGRIRLGTREWGPTLPYRPLSLAIYLSNIERPTFPCKVPRLRDTHPPYTCSLFETCTPNTNTPLQKRHWEALSSVKLWEMALFTELCHLNSAGFLGNRPSTQVAPSHRREL